MNYLTKMTVKDLREVAKRMKLTGLSSAKKAELVSVIESFIVSAHEEALQEEDTRTVSEMNSPEKEINVGVPYWTRTDSYTRQTGKGELTAKQSRRAFKKYKHQLAKGYTLSIVMGERY